MVGLGTVLRDDPELTARLTGGEVRQPLRVVVDTALRLPLEARVLREGPEVPTLVATTAKAPSEKVRAVEEMGREVLVLPERNGRVDLEALMRELGRRQILSLLLEGGAELNGAMLEAGLVDKVLLVFAPILLGNRAAKPLLEGLEVPSLREAWRLEDIRVEQVEGDIHVEGRLARGS
jgi:diaminohydroxyphosphoribosylaminopyrimidine deaminase/5-amino-6-(5-phosphoribosylamino)uracil reductase